MPGLYPASTYPFALQFLLFFGSLFFTVFKDRWMRVERQIVLCAAISAALFALIPFLANIGGVAGYWLVFCDLVVLGWFLGLFQGLLYSENTKLPGAYIGIFLTSQGLAGIFSNLLRFVSLEIWPDAPLTSTSFCYLFGVSFLLLCIPAQLQLNKNKFALFY